MKSSIVRSISILFVGSAFCLMAGCQKPEAQETATASSASTSSSSKTKAAKVASKLGDLSMFRSIATEVAAIVDKKNLPAAKTRIKALEEAWDAAEAGLKPRAADDWHRLDKVIDQALTALRADTPSQADSKAALVELLKTFDALEGKS